MTKLLIDAGCGPGSQSCHGCDKLEVQSIHTFCTVFGCPLVVMKDKNIDGSERTMRCVECKTAEQAAYEVYGEARREGKHIVFKALETEEAWEELWEDNKAAVLRIHKVLYNTLNEKALPLVPLTEDGEDKMVELLEKAHQPGGHGPPLGKKTREFLGELDEFEEKSKDNDIVVGGGSSELCACGDHEKRCGSRAEYEFDGKEYCLPHVIHLICKRTTCNSGLSVVTQQDRIVELETRLDEIVPVLRFLLMPKLTKPLTDKEREWAEGVVERLEEENEQS